MRTLCSVMLVLAVVGCKKGDSAADSTAAADSAAAAAAPAPAPPAPGAKFAGAWEGMAYMGTDKKGEKFTVMSDSSGNSTAVGATGDTVRFHTVSQTDTSFVLESDRYMNKEMKAEVMEHVEGRMVSDSLVGTMEVRPSAAGAKPMSGRWSAHRKSS